MNKCSETGKTIFSKKGARPFVASSANEVRKDGYLRYYECPFCNGWHVTHQELMKPYFNPAPLKHENEFKKYMQA